MSIIKSMCCATMGVFQAAGEPDTTPYEVEQPQKLAMNAPEIDMHKDRNASDRLRSYGSQ